MKQIEIKNLKFGYNENQILKNVNLNLDEGDFAVISGKNGSGKSTLIKLILGELKKDKGIIKLFGIDMEDFKNFDKIGYVPQVNEAIKVAFPVSAREYVGAGAKLVKAYNYYLKEIDIEEYIKKEGGHVQL